jgi:hypothetical protein
MSEPNYSALVFVLILIGVSGLIWSNVGFERMARILGPFGRWGMVVAPPGLGKSLAMIGTIVLGLAALPPRFSFYPESWRNWLLVVFLGIVGTGFIHDVLAPPFKAKIDRER